MYYSRPYCTALELELQTLMSAGNKIVWKFIYLAAKLLFTYSFSRNVITHFVVICCISILSNEPKDLITFSLVSLNIFSLVSRVAGQYPNMVKLQFFLKSQKHSTFVVVGRNSRHTTIIATDNFLVRSTRCRQQTEHRYYPHPIA